MADASRSGVPVKIEAAGDTHIGGRAHNEDAILLRPDLNLYMVADGAGGQNAGNVASSLAITTVAHFFEQTQVAADKLPEFDGLGLPTAARRLSTAVQEANKEILEISKTSDRHEGMGTTIVAALFDVPRRRLHVAHVGDSRCYRLRAGRLELLTFDHSLINDVLELRPNIDDARVRKLPQNVITRALGMSDNLRVSVRTHELLHGDCYMMCSDGLTDVVNEAQITEALGLDVACDERVALLINMSLEAGANDNVASVIVDCALPGSTAKAATRPIKSSPRRASRPAMPRVAPADRESTPEIAGFDRTKSDRDSAPVIQVVPADAGASEVVEALQDVMDPDDHDEPTPPELSRSEAEGAEAGRYALINDEASDDAMLKKRPSQPPPASEGGGRLGLPGARRHPTQPRSPAAKKKGAAKKGKRKRGERAYSAPRLNKPDVGASAKVDTRTGDTKRPPSRPPVGPLVPSYGAPAAKIKKIPSSPSLGAMGHNPVSDRVTLAGTPPLPRKPVPPARAPLATSEFTGDGDDAIPCHACGSVISQRAEFCMYCGATTGFVVPEQ